MYLELRMRYEKREHADAKIALDDAISELMKEGRTREQAILYLYFYESPEYELLKNRWIPLIVVLNIILYSMVLLSRTVFPIVMISFSETASYHGGPWALVLFMVGIVSFIYFIVGVTGSCLLLKHRQRARSRNLLIYILSMIVWVLEIIWFSFWVGTNILQIPLREITARHYLLWFYFNFLLYLSIVVLKIASIAYFAKKKVRHAYGFI
jgi:hypothetical protein